MPHPVMMGGPPGPPYGMMPGGPVMMGGQPPMMSAGPGPGPGPGFFGIHPEPATGIGPTPGEAQAEQAEFAYTHGLHAPQDFKPADDDVSRMYYVRELDGNWTLRNRATIDGLGDCRWYITDVGVFYAVRLPN